MPRRLREKIWPIAIGLAAVGYSVWGMQTDFGPIRAATERAESLVYDQRLLLTRPADPEPDERVVIIDIDERSLAELGRWPWPRALVGDLVDRLWDYGAVVVAFDVVFAEPERNVVEEVARAVDNPDAKEQLLELQPYFDGDRLLAESISRGDAVLGYVLHGDKTDSHAGALPPPSLTESKADGPPLALPRFPAFTGNLPALQDAADAAGFFTVMPDDDGVVRRAPLVLGHGDGIYSSLALETVRLYQLLDEFELRTGALGDHRSIDAVELGNTVLRTDAQGRAIVPYRGPRGSFHYVSAADIIDGRADPELLIGSIALIGTSAIGLFDLRATPVGSVFPGVEIHANLIAGMLDGAFPYRPAWADGADLVTVAGLGILAALAMPFLGPIGTVLLALTFLAGTTAWNFWAWNEHGLVLGYAPIVFAVSLVTVLNLGWGFLFEHRRRNTMRKRFGEYVPPELVDEMSERPDDFGFEGETRELTILFADIRSFTTISEPLDAGELKDLLNRFFTPMTRVIFENRGTIDKYVGDMIMAFWGAPISDPEHRRHAVRAALGMLREAARLREVFSAEGLPAIHIGIGLNSGVANVGDMGSEYRRAYTALGDAVNLASRVEGATKSYGVAFAVTGSTKEGIEDEFAFRELDRVRVKGKREPVTLYEVVAPLEELTAAESQRLSRHAEALRLFRERRWDEAEAVFRALAEERSDRCAELHLERIAELREADPGEGWDGVFDRTEK